MLIRKCDRCGKNLDVNYYELRMIKKNENGLEPKTLYKADLCSTCKQNIDIYLEKEDQI